MTATSSAASKTQAHDAPGRRTSASNNNFITLLYCSSSTTLFHRCTTSKLWYFKGALFQNKIIQVSGFKSIVNRCTGTVFQLLQQSHRHWPPMSDSEYTGTDDSLLILKFARSTCWLYIKQTYSPAQAHTTHFAKPTLETRQNKRLCPTQLPFWNPKMNL